MIDQEVTGAVATLDLSAGADLLTTGNGLHLKPNHPLAPMSHPVRRQFRPERLVVAYVDTATDSQISQFEQGLGAELEEVGWGGVHQLVFDDATISDLHALREQIVESPLVGGVSFSLRASGAGATDPDDPQFSEQAYLRQVGAVDAWTETCGDAEVVVAVIDCGFDLYHPDLTENLWVNVGELPHSNPADQCGNDGYDFPGKWDFDGDGRFSMRDLRSPDPAALTIAQTELAAATGIDFRSDLDESEGGDPNTFSARDLLLAFEDGFCDDDGNGVRDDLIGANVATGAAGDFDFASGDVRARDSTGFSLTANAGTTSWSGTHGTAVAGLIGASANNGRNIAGLAQEVSLMLISVDNNDDCHVDAVNVLNGVYYATQNGAHVVNMSIGHNDVAPSAELHDATLETFQVQYEAALADPPIPGLPLLVVAAGNGTSNLDLDTYVGLPSELQFDQKIVVTGVGPSFDTATDWALELPADHGPSTVELAAPGHGGMRSVAWHEHGGDTWEAIGGTSSAAPLVSGAAALMLSDVGLAPNCDGFALRTALAAGASSKDELEDFVANGAFLKVDSALDAMTCQN